MVVLGGNRQDLTLWSSVRVILLLVPVLLALSQCQFAEARSNDSKLKFMSWADPNTADWDRKLHISGIRMGCSAEPVNCMKTAAIIMQSHANGKLFLSVVLKPGELEGNATEYSKLSQQSPFLEEVGIDDFVGQYARLFTSGSGDPVATLSSVVNGLKSQNKNLHFGITLYENELDSPYLKEPKMTAALRNGVDYVHLFLIYRSNARNYESYVRKAKEIFPNAKIIGGVYAYDRISYIPCAPSDSRPCTAQEELALFKQALEIELRLLKNGELDWMEFFPGAFGNEATWNAWDRPRICPGRKQDCIANTQKLRQALADAFSKEVE
jgi:hypothetical protein